MTKKPNPRSQGREFGIVMAVFFAIVAAVRYGRGHGLNLTLVGVAGAFLLLGLIVPTLLVPLYRVWTRLGKALGYFNSRVLLFLIYYLLVTPIGLLRRMFNPDPLKQRLAPAAPSYWEDCEPETRESLEHQY